MWGFDGQKLSDPADPIPFRKGERARVTLVGYALDADDAGVNDADVAEVIAAERAFAAKASATTTKTAFLDLYTKIDASVQPKSPQCCPLDNPMNTARS